MTKTIYYIGKNSSEILEIEEFLKRDGLNYNFFLFETYDEIKKINFPPDFIIYHNDTQIDNNRDILSKIKEGFPHSFRIFITDDKDNEGLKSGLTFAHRILSKPFSEKKLQKCFINRDSLCNLLKNKELSSLIYKINFIPSLPAVYVKLEEELANPNTSMHKISDIISHDISFTVKVLQVVNSSFFGIEGKITDTMSAVNYLGKNVLKSLMLYHQIYTTFKIDKSVESYFEKMWIHSNKVGRFAEEFINMYCNKEYEMMEEAYIGGLLHDIGKIIMLGLKNYPNNVFELMNEENIRFSEAEYKLFGTSHAEVGAYFLTLWGLPKNIIDSVCNHKNSEIELEHFTVPTAVYVANTFANIKDIELSSIKELRLGVKPIDWLNHLEKNN